MTINHNYPLINSPFTLERLQNGEITEKEAYTHEYNEAVERLRLQDKAIKCSNPLAIAFDSIFFTINSVFAGINHNNNYKYISIAAAGLMGACLVSDIKKRKLYKQVRVQYAQEKDDLEAKLRELEE